MKHLFKAFLLPPPHDREAFLCHVTYSTSKQTERYLGKFLIRKWGGDRRNMWDPRREINRGVEDGDKPMFIEMWWQAQ